MDIVTTVITRDIPVEQRFLAPKQKQMKRTANKHRSANRPADPDNLEFEVFKLVCNLLFNQLKSITTGMVANESTIYNKCTHWRFLYKN